MKFLIILCLVVAFSASWTSGLPMGAMDSHRERRVAEPEIRPENDTPNADDSSENIKGAQSTSTPAPSSAQQAESPLYADKEGAFQSDIMLTDEQWEELRAVIADQEQTGEDGGDDEGGDDDDGESRRKKRKAVAFLQSRWPNKIVPYEISTASQPDTAAILGAMQHWMDHTCLRFEPYTANNLQSLGHNSRIFFVKEEGCWSYLGRVFNGAQAISIGEGCGSVGTVAHEIGHAIGFHHEQSRPDRDNHVNIHWENIIEGNERNFAKYTVAQVTTHEVPYDVGSIMHYGSNVSQT